MSVAPEFIWAASDTLTWVERDPSMVKLASETTYARYDLYDDAIAALKAVVAESDRHTDAYIAARAIIAKSQSEQNKTKT